MGLPGAFGAGLLLGALTGMPLGIINVAIVHGAASGRLRRSYGLAIGGALADGAHAGLAFVGIAPQLLASRWAAPAAILGGVAIGIVAIVLWTSRGDFAMPAAAVVSSTEPSDEPSNEPSDEPSNEPSDDRLWHGVTTGVSMTTLNVAALTAWVAVAAAWPVPTRKMAGAVAIGVAIGSALWFALLARWVHRRRHHRWLRHAPRAAALLLVGLAIVAIVRGASL